jgi:hypothetical protein
MCFAPYTPATESWTFLFDPNNAFTLATHVNKSFVLRVDIRRIRQTGYALRRQDPEFANTVCNPSALNMVDCVFYRAHGETVPRTSYGLVVNYKIAWNTPPIQGDKSAWMLLRARCSEFQGDPNLCNGTQKFAENTTTFVNRTAPVGTDPIVGGTGDGISDFIVAIGPVCRRGDADGDFDDKDGRRHHAHFHRNSCEGGGGDVEEDDLNSGKHFQSTSVSSATFTAGADSMAMRMVGTGLHGGLPVGFTMIAVDHGTLAPGVFMLALTDGYSFTGTLVNGSLVLQ